MVYLRSGSSAVRELSPRVDPPRFLSVLLSQRGGQTHSLSLPERGWGWGLPSPDSPSEAFLRPEGFLKDSELLVQLGLSLGELL